MMNPKELYHAAANYLRREVGGIILTVSLVIESSGGLEAKLDRPLRIPTEMYPPDSDDPLYQQQQKTDRFHGLRDLERQIGL